VENVVLSTIDKRLKFACSVPVSHPQSIDGEEVTLTQQKCSIYIRHWDYNLKCPPGKVGSIALVTQITARDDRGTGNGKPTLTPKFKGQLAFNKNKVSMQFEQQAVIHNHHQKGGKTVGSRSSVPVIMTQSKTLQWTSDPRFKSSRKVFFSFIMADTKQIKTGMLHWDPELAGNFQQNKVRTLNHIRKPQVSARSSSGGAPTPAPKDIEVAEFDTTSFMQTSLRSSGSSTLTYGGLSLMLMILTTFSVWTQQD